MQENELLKLAGRFGFDTRATPHNCACESQPSFLPHFFSLKNEKYIQYSFVFQTLNWDKKPG